MIGCWYSINYSVNDKLHCELEARYKIFGLCCLFEVGDHLQAGEILYQRPHLPIRGLSEVIGMITCTVFRNIVIESNIVTPAIAIFIKKYKILSLKDENKYFSLGLY